MSKKKFIPNLVLILVIIGGIIWIGAKFFHFGNVEYTDNAQVRQDIMPVNTRVQGFIKKIYFSEYQHVKKGDTLLVIEDSEFRLQLAQAEANYANAIAGRQAMSTSITTTQSNLSVSDAAIEEAKARLDNAKLEYDRYSELLRQEAVTRQQFDRVKTEYDAARARYDQLTRQKHSTSLFKQEQTQRLEQNDGGIKIAEAALNLAHLNLSYTVIVATADGVTGRKNIHEGQLVQPGQTMVDLVVADSRWIIANYKETQTSKMKVGQTVEITVDAVPGVTFEGKVQSISRATGASFSLVPQDNSAGNFVKVEQRIPVRIQFTEANRHDDLNRLRAGMNAECTVKL